MGVLSVWYTNSQKKRIILMIWSLLVNSIGIFVIGYILKGVQIKSFFTAIGVAILLAIINSLVKPILVFLTLPITILTFGLFILVINALMLMLVDELIEGMKIESFGWAFLFSLLLAVLNLGFFWLSYVGAFDSALLFISFINFESIDFGGRNI